MNTPTATAVRNASFHPQAKKNCVISSWTRALLPWFMLSSACLLQPTAPWATQMQNKKLKNQTHSWESCSTKAEWDSSCYSESVISNKVLAKVQQIFLEQIVMERWKKSGEGLLCQWPTHSQNGWTYLILLSCLHPLSRYSSENSADRWNLFFSYKGVCIAY